MIIVRVACDPWHLDGLNQLDGFQVAGHDLARGPADR
jgi:hypothetical protein